MAETETTNKQEFPRLRDQALDLAQGLVATKYGGADWVLETVKSKDFADLSYEMLSVEPETTRTIEELRSTGEIDYEKVYQILRKNLSLPEIVLKIIMDYGELNAQKIFEEVRDELGPEYISLLIEPALAIKIDAFIPFVKGQEKPFSSPEEAREKFIKFLPRKTTYRLLALLPNSKTTNMTHQAGIIRERERHSANLVGTLFRGLRLNIDYQVSSFTSDSPLISVTDYPEMAVSASANKRATIDENANPTLFKIECSEFYLISFGGILSNPTVSHGTDKRLIDTKWQIGNKIISGNDPGIERFFELSIPRDAKVEVMHELPQQKANVIDWG